MSRKFKLEPDWYGEDIRMYKKKTITLEEGVTVLVGCNGIGKTTLLQQIQASLTKQKIPVLSFDNLHEGGSKSLSSAAFNGDWAFAATAMASSEGENIVMNVGQLAGILRRFIETGQVSKPRDKLARALARVMGDTETEEVTSKERWILLDAIDSGLSVDNVIDIKEQLFQTILETKGDKEVYILVTANAYEMARGEQCFDVYNGKYIKLKTYEAYRKFILKTRAIKGQRYSD
jgi:ABC-type cobalamin/Fe3+-siderophores transport system ATPase subunit